MCPETIILRLRHEVSRTQKFENKLTKLKSNFYFFEVELSSTANGAHYCSFIRWYFDSVISEIHAQAHVFALIFFKDYVVMFLINIQITII